MGAISGLPGGALAGVDVDILNDLITAVDVSVSPAINRNKHMTFAELLIAIGAAATMTASEALAAGNIVNIHASSGAKIRKANATDDSKPANGFVPSAILSAAAGLVIFTGRRISGLAGLTPGATYYLDTTGGALTATPPAGSGNFVQEVGVALSATELMFNPKQGVTL